MAVQLPPCPVSLRPIQHHLKTAQEHDERDPVISYWCRLCALQSALKIDKKSDEARVFLMGLMDWLETTKKNFHDNDSITNEVAAQAYVENYALKLFLWADGQDRASNFNKNVVKAFYTAGMLMDVLTVFGELTEEVIANRKYAKWKAAYIHNCLKSGETPIPGPLKDEEEDEEANNLNLPGIGFQVDPPGPRTDAPPGAPNNWSSNIPSGGSTVGLPSFPDPPANIGGLPSPGANIPNIASNIPPSNPNVYIPPSNPNVYAPTSMPYIPYTPNTPVPSAISVPSIQSSMDNASGTKLDPESITKAQKYCKWASSALNYDDVPEAVSNLQKALKLLQTGEDS